MTPERRTTPADSGGRRGDQVGTDQVQITTTAPHTCGIAASPQQCSSWLAWLYDGCPDEQWLSAFTIDRRTGSNVVRWSRVADAYDFGERLAALEHHCVWVGCGTRAERLSNSERGGAEAVAMIPALWVDLDYLGPAHKNADRLPPDAEACLQLVDDLGLTPSAVVHSGHGLQVWYKFDQAQPADVVAPLLEQWAATWQYLGDLHGWDVDNVFDLARVMRVAGSVNRKLDDDPRPATLVDQTEATYTVDELLAATIDPPPPPPPKPKGMRMQFDDERPGDKYNADHDHDDMCRMLEEHHWTRCYAKNGMTHYARPGKDPKHGSSATVYDNNNHCYVYSSNAPIPVDSYSPFGLYAALEHGGDYSKAGRALYDDANPKMTTPPPNIDSATGQVIDLWTMRPVLTHVRQAAHARSVSADAVLGAVLARIAAVIGPEYRLPPVVVSEASLNTYVALVGPSGTAKSGASSIARELVEQRADLDGVGVSSGEGLIEAYIGEVEERDENDKKQMVRRQVHRCALVAADEGSTLARVSERNGATILEVLRSAWSGSALSTMNATKDRYRHLDEQAYRLALIVGIQPANGGAILDDAAGGLPQRFLWFSTTDADIPDTQPDWPGPIDCTPPVQLSQRHHLGVADDIRAEIIAGHLGRHRGDDQGSLGAHGDLARLKVAGLLALIEGRHAIDAEDWRIAGLIHTRSTHTRTTVVEHLAAEESRRAQASDDRIIRRTVKAATATADTTETRALESMAKNIGRRAHRDDGDEDTVFMRKVLRDATAPKHRNLASVDDAIDLALDNGWIRRDGDGFRRGESRPT